MIKYLCVTFRPARTMKIITQEAISGISSENLIWSWQRNSLIKSRTSENRNIHWTFETNATSLILAMNRFMVSFYWRWVCSLKSWKCLEFRKEVEGVPEFLCLLKTVLAYIQMSCGCEPFLTNLAGTIKLPHSLYNITGGLAHTQYNAVKIIIQESSQEN